MVFLGVPKSGRKVVLSSSALSPSKSSKIGHFLDLFFDTFSHFFVKFGVFTHFRSFSTFSELSGLRVVKSSWVSEQWKPLKNGKISGFHGVKMWSPREVQKREKVVIGQNPVLG